MLRKSRLGNRFMCVCTVMRTVKENEWKQKSEREDKLQAKEKNE